MPLTLPLGTMIHSVIICVIVLRTDWLGEVTRAASRVTGGGGGGKSVSETSMGRLKFDEAGLCRLTPG